MSIPRQIFESQPDNSEVSKDIGFAVALVLNIINIYNPISTLMSK